MKKKNYFDGKYFFHTLVNNNNNNKKKLFEHFPSSSHAIYIS